jgi:predicted DNA-binding transcriptional regulator AlpA
MTTNSNLMDRLLNEKEVAELLGISTSTIRRRRLLGQPPKATKIGGAVRYRPADIYEFLNACPTIGGARRGK